MVLTACRYRNSGVHTGILARMTDTTATPPPTIDHRQAALDALEAARVARTLSSSEYGKPAGERDYHLLGELKAAARANLQEALVHATLLRAGQAEEPVVVITADNWHDAQLAARALRRGRDLDSVQVARQATEAAQAAQAAARQPTNPA